MGRIKTPTFRIEYKVQPETVHFTPGAWDTAYYGRPNKKTIGKHMTDLIDSIQPGKANAHLLDTFPNVQLVSARVVRQASGEVVATWPK